MIWIFLVLIVLPCATQTRTNREKGASVRTIAADALGLPGIGQQQAYPAAVSHPAKEFYTEQVPAYQDLESGCPDLGNQARVVTSD